MDPKLIPQITLNSGHKMPSIGMGCGAYPHPPPDVQTTAFLDAIQAGYRHFDTASIYRSEEPLGRAVALAIDRGLVKSRRELFITTKLYCTDAEHDLILPALHKSLKTLGVEYVDLYLIHYPLRFKPGVVSYHFTKEDLLPIDIRRTWEAMEECFKLGLTKSIGVSNYSSKKLAQVLKHATIPPAVNQVEMHAALQQKKLLQFCKEKGIKLSAYSPLAGNGSFMGSLAVTGSPILKEIAAGKGKTVSQVALRWIHQQGAIIVCKSFNKERMKENIQIYEWELTEEEMEKIKHITQQRCHTGESYISPNGPYKSIEEIWDGDDHE